MWCVFDEDGCPQCIPAQQVGYAKCTDADCRHYLPNGDCVLRLARRGGMSVYKIAPILGVSKTTVFNIEKAALKKLSSKLSGLSADFFG